MVLEIRSKIGRLSNVSKNDRLKENDSNGIVDSRKHKAISKAPEISVKKYQIYGETTLQYKKKSIYHF